MSAERGRASGRSRFRNATRWSDGRGYRGRANYNRSWRGRGFNDTRQLAPAIRGRGEPPTRRDGTPIACYRCGGSHFVRDCPCEPVACASVNISGNNNDFGPSGGADLCTVEPN
uniref:CCHC-type domain-containing protein n=1 Tax=Strigamia maritima TaxID=126957 RepID=T1IMH8_STRMM